MNKYSQRWVRLLPMFWRGDGAITLGQTAYFSCAAELVSKKWHEHEDFHKWQWEHEGKIKFTIKYLWYSFRYGYKMNPFEVAAGEF